MQAEDRHHNARGDPSCYTCCGPNLAWPANMVRFTLSTHESNDGRNKYKIFSDASARCGRSAPCCSEYGYWFVPDFIANMLCALLIVAYSVGQDQASVLEAAILNVRLYPTLYRIGPTSTYLLQTLIPGIRANLHQFARMQMCV